MKCETCKLKRVCDELERMGKVPKHEKCRCYAPTKPITNADRIRSMTDEELAEWLERIRVSCANDYCTRNCPLGEVCYSLAKAPKRMIDYLKEEATDA